MAAQKSIFWQADAQGQMKALAEQLAAVQQAQTTSPEAVLAQRLEDALTALDKANQVSISNAEAAEAKSMLCGGRVPQGVPMHWGSMLSSA